MKLTNKLVIILLLILIISPVDSNSASVLLNARVLNNFFWRVKKDINPHFHNEIEFTTKVSKDDRLGIGIVPFLSHSFDDNAVDETDWYLYLTYKTEKIDMRGGYVYYYVIGDGDQNRPENGELYSSVIFNGKLGKINCYTGMSAYFDVGDSGTAYTETEFSFDIGNSAASKVFLNLGSIVGFDFGQFLGVDASPQFTVLQLKASLNFRIAERVYIVPDYTFVIPLDSSLFQRTDIWGLSLSFR